MILLISSFLLIDLCAPLRLSSNLTEDPQLTYDVSVVSFSRDELTKYENQLSNIRNAPTLQIALCVRGQARMFHTDTISQAMKKHLIDEVEQHQKASVDVFLNFDAAAQHNARLQQMLPGLAAKNVTYTDAGHKTKQYLRLGVCHAMIQIQEARSKSLYDWVLQARTDLLFSGPLPWLRNLPTDSAYARMRQFDFKYTMSDKIPLNALSAERQESLWHKFGCGAWLPGHTTVCEIPHSKIDEYSAFRMDDQFAIVPRAQFDAYFRCGSQAEIGQRSAKVSSYTNEKVSIQSCTCCVFTHNVLQCGVKVIPTALYFSLARNVEGSSIVCAGESGSCAKEKKEPEMWLRGQSLAI